MKIRTPNGKIETVMKEEESRIITYESAARNKWYHPSKVVDVIWHERFNCYVTVPEA
jgi:hypothetical protein